MVGFACPIVFGTWVGIPGDEIRFAFPHSPFVVGNAWSAVGLIIPLSERLVRSGGV
jgi:hypothetical protein